jgi:hypothetical protein
MQTNQINEFPIVSLITFDWDAVEGKSSKDSLEDSIEAGKVVFFDCAFVVRDPH